MADGEGFDRSVVLVFNLMRDTLWPVISPFRWKLRCLFRNCELYVKSPDNGKDLKEPVLIRRRRTPNGFVLYLKLPLGMAPQDFDRARDKIEFALGGTISCQATSNPRIMEMTVT